MPLDCLPRSLRDLALATGHATKSDPAMVALPGLVVLASAIGTTRRIKLKNQRREYPILWGAVVMKSGGGKTHTTETTLRPVWSLQRDAEDKYNEDIAAYEKAKGTRPRGGRKASDPDPSSNTEAEPTRPVKIEIYTENTTTEAMILALKNQERGLLLARDELSGWFRSHNQYKSGKGSDEADWLQTFNGNPMKVNRKTGDHPSIFVRRAAMWITGTVQPRVLARCLSNEYFENGLASRFLFVMPPPRKKVWSEADVEDAVQEAYNDVHVRLRLMEHCLDKKDRLAPIDIPLSFEAKQLWIEFFNTHAEAQEAQDDDLFAAYAKLECYCARLSLVICLARAAEAGDPATVTEIDGQSMSHAIELTRWFTNETERLYAILREGDEERELRSLLEFVDRRGGEITLRDFYSAKRVPAEEGESMLERLVHAGLAEWFYPPVREGGGHQPKTLRLLKPADDACPADGPENGASAEC